MLASGVLTLLRVAAFCATLALWNWALHRTFSAVGNMACIVGTLLAVFPTAWIARKLLDAKPTPERVAWVTSGVHASLMVFFGIAIIKAVQTAETWRGFVLPVPRPLGRGLVYVTSAVLAFTVVNLAARGLGAPFSIVLSRRLATEWLYARTRNPMVLATLAWLVAIGLLLQAGAFVLWVVALAAPAWIAYLKTYEERELELRFGAPYLAYKARTPFLWPSFRREPASAVKWP